VSLLVLVLVLVLALVWLQDFLRRREGEFLMASASVSDPKCRRRR
jgi:hypothetical protein